MEGLLGTGYGVFFIVTIVVMGFAAYVTGQGPARTHGVPSVTWSSTASYWA